MKKQILKTGIFLLAIIFIAVSCTKDEDSDTPQTSKTVTEYLTAGNWKVTAMTIDPGVNFGGTIITDFYSQMPACSKDDLIKFNTNGTITDDEGATKCNPNDPQTTNDGTWVLSADNTAVTLNYPDEDPQTVTIIELNDATMKGSYTVVEDFGTGELTYTFTITLSKQ